MIGTTLLPSHLRIHNDRTEPSPCHPSVWRQRQKVYGPSTVFVVSELNSVDVLPFTLASEERTRVTGRSLGVERRLFLNTKCKSYKVLVTHQPRAAAVAIIRITRCRWQWQWHCSSVHNTTKDEMRIIGMSFAVH